MDGAVSHGSWALVQFLTFLFTPSTKAHEVKPGAPQQEERAMEMSTSLTHVSQEPMARGGEWLPCGPGPGHQAWDLGLWCGAQAHL